MTERLIYDPGSGTLTEFQNAGIVAITDEERAAVVQMLGAQYEEAKAHGRNVITSDPNDYINTELAKVQGHQKILTESGIILANPGIVFNISENDLSIGGALEVMANRGLLYDNRESETYYINSFLHRQNLATGGYLTVDEKMQMRGYTWLNMRQNDERFNQQIGSATDQRLGSLILGVMPNLYLYNQSYGVRDEMHKEGLGVYTPDVAAGGYVAGVDDWHRSRRACMNSWEGDSRLFIGSRSAVVENPSSSKS